jgi:hypothetical protein
VVFLLLKIKTLQTPAVFLICAGVHAMAFILYSGFVINKDEVRNEDGDEAEAQGLMDVEKGGKDGI